MGGVYSSTGCTSQRNERNKESTISIWNRERESGEGTKERLKPKVNISRIATLAHISVCILVVVEFLLDYGMCVWGCLDVDDFVCGGVVGDPGGGKWTGTESKRFQEDDLRE
ncbi:hypothetical protein Tco_0544983 [Tanacetum coccineum]